MINNTDDLLKLREQQKLTDLAAAETHGLDINSPEWFDNRIIALLIEMIEVLQVTEDFKDWKIQKGKVDPKRFTKTLTDNNEEMYQDGIKDELIDKTEALRRTKTEECSDALHFTLSFINLFDYNNDITIHENMKPKQCTIDCVKALMETQKEYVKNDYKLNDATYNAFKDFINYFFTFIKLNHVTINELKDEYWLKNKVNFDRLDSGY